MRKPRLFTPTRLGPLALRNRIAVAPMCQYSAIDGLPQPWHEQHLGRLALSGAGVVIVEATAVEATGRITAGDTGLWNDEQRQGFAHLLRRIRTYSDTPIGIQLAHAGRKAATNPPWIEQGGPAHGDSSWPTCAASALPFKPGWPTPSALDGPGMQRVLDAFVQAARRADAAGFDLLELHAAHGYLLSGFLSPLANRRADAYGGSPANRARFPLEVARAVRDAWPRDKPLGMRFNGSEWTDAGVQLDEVIAFGRAVTDVGIDYLHVSSGGTVADAKIPSTQPGYQVHLAEALKAAVPDATVIAVGMVVDPAQAEDILARGQVDLVAIARAALDDPHWVHHAAAALGEAQQLPPQYRAASKGNWPGFELRHHRK